MRSTSRTGEAVFAHADDVKRDFGTAHFVFNNAGTTVVGTVEHLSIEEIEWQLGINLWGVIYGTKAFLPMMLAQREGCIVNISSVFGLIGFPLQSAYNISKFGVRGLTECLWSELDGTGVRAVVVHPGGIRTNIEKAARRCAAAGEEEAHFRRSWATRCWSRRPRTARPTSSRASSAARRRIVTGSWSTRFFWLSRFLPNSYPALILAQVAAYQGIRRAPDRPEQSSDQRLRRRHRDDGIRAPSGALDRRPRRRGAAGRAEGRRLQGSATSASPTTRA